MKKLFIQTFFIAMLSIQLICFSNVTVKAQETKNTKVEQSTTSNKNTNNTKKKTDIKKVKKTRKKCFYTSKRGNTYYYNKKGQKVTGWQKIKNNYYYFSKHGVMRKGCEVDGITINKKGTIKLTNYNLSKIKTLKKAANVVNKITKPGDSKSQKLKKCYDWIISFPYCRYRKVSEVKNQNWETIFANDIFDNGKGCCVSESAAFAFLARACGYTDVYVCNDTSHGWTEIDGYVYDPLFSEAKDYWKYYKCPYSTYRLSPIGGKVKV